MEEEEVGASEALTSGREQHDCDQMESIDSRDVKNGCRVIILNREQNQL